MGETAGERKGVAGDRLPTATAPHAAPPGAPRESGWGSRRPTAQQSASAASAGRAGQRRGEAPATALLHLQLFSKVPPGSATRGQGCKAARLPRGCRTSPPRTRPPGDHRAAFRGSQPCVSRCPRPAVRPRPARRARPGTGLPPRRAAPAARSVALHTAAAADCVPPGQTRSSLPCTRSQCRRRQIKVSSTFLDPVMVGYTGRTERSRSPRRVWKSHD